MCNELGIFRLTDINKYLIGRFMFRYCNNQVPALFHSFFAYNHEIHSYDTRSGPHFHIPQKKTNFGKTGIRYRGAIIRNNILSKGIYPDTSECVFVKFLKTILMAIRTLSNRHWLLQKSCTHNSFRTRTRTRTNLFHLKNMEQCNTTSFI